MIRQDYARIGLKRGLGQTRESLGKLRGIKGNWGISAPRYIRVEGQIKFRWAAAFPDN